jgi:H+-translocating NAD(P) transhydrogenase subunit alpha
MPVIFIPKETTAGEARVAATPDTTRRYVKEGLSVLVEPDAGSRANFDDAMYIESGATVVDRQKGWTEADVVLSVNPPSAGDIRLMKSGALLVSLLYPHRNLDLVRALAERGVHSVAMELMPRITRAQTMDVLSSQASIAGYKAVLVAASRLAKYFPLLMTAAGTIKPARVVIMGAGVAGLQAVATAKRLGALVEVSDIRPAVKEQVESLGGKFIELPLEESGEGAGGYAKEMGEDFLRRQREIVAERVAVADVVITTAQIPGKKAPTLITEEMVKRMKRGAVIIDLAVDSGGNCEISEPDREVEKYGVHILGYSNLPATVAQDASTMYARNLQALMLEIISEGQIRIDLENEVIAESLLVHEGAVRHAPTKELMAGGS